MALPHNNSIYAVRGRNWREIWDTNIKAH